MLDEIDKILEYLNILEDLEMSLMVEDIVRVI